MSGGLEAPVQMITIFYLIIRGYLPMPWTQPTSSSCIQGEERIFRKVLEQKGWQSVPDKMSLHVWVSFFQIDIFLGYPVGWEQTLGLNPVSSRYPITNDATLGPINGSLNRWETFRKSPFLTLLALKIVLVELRVFHQFLLHQ